MKRSATRAFYDTVIFNLSLNEADADYQACAALLDIDSAAITWCIVISAITRAEASLDEYLNQLEQRCALQGVEWVEVSSPEIAAVAQKQRSLKAKLIKAGMQSPDVKQAFAAVAGKASLFVTRDRDFRDPKDKGQRGKKSRGTAVHNLLRDMLDLAVHFPADAHAKLTALSTA